MQQVSGAVVAYGIFSPLCYDVSLYLITNSHVAFSDAPVVDNQPFNGTACVLHLEDTHRPGNVTPVTYLPSALCIKRRRIENEQGILRGTDTLRYFSTNNDPNNFAAARNPLVA